VNVDRDVQEGVGLVTVSGELDLASVDELRAAVSDVAGRSRSVVVDVSDVSFIDSTALAALLRSNDELRSDGVAMIVACPPAGAVRRLLTMTSLDDRLTLAADRPGALARAKTVH
jgi:anti-anti-sigma factor